MCRGPCSYGKRTRLHLNLAVEFEASFTEFWFYENSKCKMNGWWKLEMRLQKSCEGYKNLWHNLILYEDVLRGCWRKLCWSLSHNGWLRMLEVPWLLDICKENRRVKQGPGKATCIPGTRRVVLQEPWWHHTFWVFDRVAWLGVFPVGLWVCFGQVFLCYSPIHPFLIGMLIFVTLNIGRI